MNGGHFKRRLKSLIGAALMALALALMAAPAAAGEAPNVVWDRTYGAGESEWASSVVALADGGLAVAGGTKSKGAGNWDMWVLRLDGSGNAVWERTFGGGEDDGADSVVALADGGLAVAGFTASKGAGGGDMWVLRLNGSGNEVWDRTFGGGDLDLATSVVALADGGLAVAGRTTSKGAGKQDMWVLRLDGSGNVVWDRTFGGGEDDWATSVVALADGGLAVAGLTASKGAGNADMWVLRLNGSGNVVWDRTFGGSENDWASSVVALADGGLAVAGHTESKGAGDADMWVLRLDGSGNVVWERTFGGGESDEAGSVVALADGGLAVAGSTRSKGAGTRDMWVLRLDGSGNVLWDRTFGGGLSDWASSVVALADGGLAVAGGTESKGAGKFDVWVLRLDGGE